MLWISVPKFMASQSNSCQDISVKAEHVNLLVKSCWSISVWSLKWPSLEQSPSMGKKKMVTGVLLKGTLLVVRTRRISERTGRLTQTLNLSWSYFNNAEGKREKSPYTNIQDPLLTLQLNHSTRLVVFPNIQCIKETCSFEFSGTSSLTRCH